VWGPLYPSILQQHWPYGVAKISEWARHTLYPCNSNNGISIVMYVSDQFVDGKLQLTDYRDPSTIGVLLLQDENDNKKD